MHGLAGIITTGLTNKLIKMNLREQYRRLKYWQSHAFDYDFDEHELHYCVNCENTYAGNYCPHCSQKTGLGKITWGSVIKGALEVWGMNTRSLPYTLLQLMFRPGLMISEYINGKRQVSFPPVKMLLILGIVSVAIDHLFVITDALSEDITPIVVGRWKSLHNFLAWVESEPGWGWLVISGYFLIPTWAIFRYSPKNPRHTLPQGFFIQVFLSMQVLIVDDIADIFSDAFYVLIPLCYAYVNRQLFGYGFWGTIWRTLAVMVSGLILAFSAIYLYDFFSSSEGYSSIHDLLGYFILLALGLALTFSFMGISKLCARHQEKKKAVSTISDQEECQSE